MRVINLRAWFPLLTALLFGLMLLSWGSLHYRHLIESAQQQQFGFWRENLSRLQANVSRELLRGETSEAQAIISSYSTNPYLLVLAVIDDSGQVLLSNRNAWRNQPAGKLPGYLQYADAHIDHRFQLDVTHNHNMFALLPLTLSAQDHSLGKLSEGHLYFLYDLAHVPGFVRKSLLADMGNVLPVLVLGVLLVWLMLQQFVIRPLRVLQNASVHMMRGRFLPVTFKGGGEMAQVAMSFNDMAGRILAEQQRLRTSEERIRFLLDSSGEAIFGVDMNGNFTFVNPACLQVLGYDSDLSLLGKNAHALIHHSRPDGSHYPEEECLISLSFREGRGLRVEDEVLWRADGSSIPIEYRAYPIRQKDQVSGCVVNFMDISERKRTEAELERHRERLEELVDARTGELRDAQGELLRKERLATLGLITATVSHELRNPLGALRLSLYVVRKKLDSSDKRALEAMDRADRNIERCDHIIDELLDFARVADADLHAVRVDEWLGAILDEQDIPGDIRVERNFALNNTEVAIDADRMRRAVINVVENACHAMRESNQFGRFMGHACLTVTTRGNEDRIEIIIRDTGSGMAEGVLERIFEPLFSTRSFGVGLGMPSVKQVMEQHKGGIEIETEEGLGTRVTLWLPRVVVEPGNGEASV